MFEPQARIDEELAWGLGWGIEIGRRQAVWQWGNDPGYKNFVIGRPAEGQGVVVFTNGDRGAEVTPRWCASCSRDPIRRSKPVTDRAG